MFGVQSSGCYCICDLSTVELLKLNYNRLVCNTLVNRALQCVDSLLHSFKWRQGWDNMCVDGWYEDRRWRWDGVRTRQFHGSGWGWGCKLFPMSIYTEADDVTMMSSVSLYHLLIYYSVTYYQVWLVWNNDNHRSITDGPCQICPSSLACSCTFFLLQYKNSSPSVFESRAVAGNPRDAAVIFDP